MIWIILILAFGLRLISINQSLWLDEAANVVGSTQYSFWLFLTKYTLGDFHPPVYFAILWIWDHIFGISELSVRLPSVIFAVATVYLVFLIGKKIWNHNVGLLAALLLAISPLQLYYSQEARMYSFAAFAVALSFYFLLKIFEDKKYIWWYGLSVGLVLYADYVAYLIIPVQLFYCFWKEKKSFRTVFLGQLIGLLTLLPWLLIFPSQLLNGRSLEQAVPGWRVAVGGTGIKDLGLVWVKLLIGRISFESKFLYAGIILLVSIFYGFIVCKLRSKKDLLIWSWFVLPIALAFLLSFIIPVLSYFRLVYITSAWVLLLAAGFSQVKKRYQPLAIILVVIINFIFCGIYLFNPTFHREDWKGMVSFLDKEGSAQNIVLLENNGIPAPFEYQWHHKIDVQGGLNNFPANSASDVKDLNSVLQNKTKVYLVDYLVDIADPKRLLVQKLKKEGFTQTKVDNFNGVGFVYEYTKN
jgi:mannosyltransferase